MKVIWWGNPGQRHNRLGIRRVHITAQRYWRQANCPCKGHWSHSTLMLLAPFLRSGVKLWRTRQNCCSCVRYVLILRSPVIARIVSDGLNEYSSECIFKLIKCLNTCTRALIIRVCCCECNKYYYIFSNIMVISFTVQIPPAWSLYPRVLKLARERI